MFEKPVYFGFPLGYVHFNLTLILNYTDFWTHTNVVEPTSEALDGDIETYYHAKDKTSWFLRLNRQYVMKWILIMVRGGKCVRNDIKNITECVSNVKLIRFQF
jgi:hypothetical protein